MKKLAELVLATMLACVVLVLIVVGFTGAMYVFVWGYVP